MGRVKNLLSLLTASAVILAQVPAGSLAEESERSYRLLEIEIHRGDTLSRFARRYLDDPSRWPELLEYNELPSGDPNLILPGHTLLVPVELVRDEIADIIYIQNSVRVRRKDAPSWTGAGLYERLFPDDGIRTGSGSFAQLEYLTGGGVNINENSLVFLRPEPDREEVVNLEAGQLRAQDVKVLTASAIIDPEAGSEYVATVDEDQTTTLSVYRGQVDFISSGELVAVSEGFMSRAEFDSPPSRPVKLPDPPEFEGLEGRLDRYDSEGSFSISGILESVNFEEAERTERESLTGVHVQLARDREFTRMVYDKVVERDRHEEWRESLEDGTYWWRAALVTDTGARGNFSEPVMYEVDTRYPFINIESPQEGSLVKRRIVSVSGRTRPGVSVTVNGRSTRVDGEGRFVAAVNVRFGENVVQVEATDRRGRVTEREITFEGYPVEEEERESRGMLAAAGVAASVASVVLIILLAL